MSAQQLADLRVMPTYRRLPVTFVRGSGIWLEDDSGRKYLDFVAGIAVTALGHSHPAVTAAVSDQAARLVHTSNLYYTEPMAKLADRLCGLLGWDDGKVFFANSGAEANECAIKLVRRWSTTKFGPNRSGTIAMDKSFHGRTLETLAATGQPAKWEGFAPLPRGFRHVPFDDLAALEAAIDPGVCSVLLEPVQGEGGIFAASPGYLEGVRDMCDRHDLAFICDEVQTGLGRTGKWFASEGSNPDVITLAKALGNGLPIGACAARGELASAFRQGDHATTLGGGPVICAAALAVLDTIESENLVENAREMGAHLKQQLGSMNSEVMAGVRGEGLLLAVTLREPLAREVVIGCLEEGLLVNDVAPDAVRLCPPLTVSLPEIEQAVETLKRVIRRVSSSVVTDDPSERTAP